MEPGGKHYNKLLEHKDFKLIEYYVDKKDFESAYKIANSSGNQTARELTLYCLYEYGVFRLEPLYHMDYVPENYLYEAVEENLTVYVYDGIEEIKDRAFAFCKIKKLIISNKVKKIGDGALSLNAGEIHYEGTKQEFIGKFLGKSKCFLRSNKSQTVICSDGELVIEK